MRGEARVLPFASGQVLPLPSFASRGIGECHLPPLGEGKDGCEFAKRSGLTPMLLRGIGHGLDSVPYVAPQSAKMLPDFRRGAFPCVGTALFFRSVARQVSSALVSLTAVFGMGTGGPSPLKAPTMVHLQGLEPWTP